MSRATTSTASPLTTVASGQVTLFPVITGATGKAPLFQGAADFDLELIEHRTLDSHIQELTYRPTLHV